jgi:hypothetical protein
MTLGNAATFNIPNQAMLVNQDHVVGYLNVIG